jgi:hypothetical protein
VAHGDRTADLIGAGVNQVWVQRLPTEISLPVVLRIGGIENEPAAKLRIELLGPAMSSFGELETEITLDEPQDHQPGYEISDVFPIEVRFRVERKGNHSVEILLDGKHAATAFFVVHIEAPAAST